MSDDTPDSPDKVDLTQGEGHWTDERDTNETKSLEEMTPEEVREQYPKRGEEIIESLAETEGTKVAEVLAGEDKEDT